MSRLPDFLTGPDPWVFLSLLLTSIPLTMLLLNLPLFRRLPRTDPAATPPRVSVLIPARDEQAHIEDAMRSVLANRDVELELIVLDDHSRDATAAIVQTVAAEWAHEGRVRLEASRPLPAGWVGKQWACWQLAEHATMPQLVWIDADVELAPDALVRMLRERERRGVSLLSGFPRQVTKTLMEQLVVPLIQVVLVGYLPIAAMRNKNHVGLGAGCGQLLLAEKAAYFAAGGHESIRGSSHDGVALPRAYRRAGYTTDLYDATDVARCRMYRTAGEVWRGFAKNAHEGLGSNGGIVVWTVLLGGAFVLPWVLLLLAATGLLPVERASGAVCLGIAAGMSGLISLICGVWFGHPWRAIVFRPVGVGVLLAIQWYALVQRLRGRRPTWRGRAVEPV